MPIEYLRPGWIGISEPRRQFADWILIRSSTTSYNPERRHNSSTRPFTSSDMRITPGLFRIE